MILESELELLRKSILEKAGEISPETSPEEAIRLLRSSGLEALRKLRENLSGRWMEVLDVTWRALREAIEILKDKGIDVRTPRVRFAPSPTGHLHIGGARTALFNWLFARSLGGDFLLRIEDTDRERSKKEYEESILRDLKWLGLEWDGMKRQSDDFEKYKKLAYELLERGLAYRCFCTKEELERMREEQRRRGVKIGYDGRCRNLSQEEIEKRLKEGKPFSIRFKVPRDGRVISFTDGLAGKLEMKVDEIEDFVILKSDGTPTYNFAVVVDDHQMGITHVLRGAEHTVNTFKQILIYEAFGWEIPQYLHLSIILDEQRKKLSKRKGSVFVSQFREEGYLPETLFNFLALLGWSSKDNREKIEPAEITLLFNPKNLSNSPAVFDYKKLLWLNGQYLQEMSDEELLSRLKPWMEERGWDLNILSREAQLILAREHKTRGKTLSEILDLVDYIFQEVTPPEEELMKLMSKVPLQIWEEVLQRLEGLEFSSPEEIEETIKSFVSEKGLKLRHVAQGIRIAITGKRASCGLFHAMYLVGKDRTLSRVRRALEKVRSLESVKE